MVSRMNSGKYTLERKSKDTALLLPEGEYPHPEA